MSPQVFSCDPRFLDQLKEGQKKVIITCWDESGREELFEKLQELESPDTAVFVIDRDSCPSLAVELKLEKAGDTVILKEGAEAGRVMIASEEDIKKAKEI